MYQISKAKKNLEAIKKFQALSFEEIAVVKETYSLLEEAETELEEQEEQYCHWVQQDSELSLEWLVCENYFFKLAIGYPGENGMLFCPYCGKYIMEHPYNEDASEDEEVTEKMTELNVIKDN